MCNGMDVELFKEIRESAKVENLSIQDRDGNDRDFILTSKGDYHEVAPIPKVRKDVAVGDIPSFCAHVKRFAAPEGAERKEAIIVIGSQSIRADVGVGELLDDGFVVTLPLFSADLPPKVPVDFDAFTLYLDRNKGKIRGVIRDFAGASESEMDEASIRLALKEITSEQAESTKVEDRGTHTDVTVKASRKTTTTTAIPSVLVFNLRRGVREFETPHEFRLRIEGHGECKLFRLDHLNRDGAEEAFFKWAKDQLASGLPDFEILQGV